MKVYVSELPKSCIDCPCESEYYCNLLNRDIEFLELTKGCKDCPLQSLADYTKQVRKEVIEKVYKVLEQAVPHDLRWSWAVIKKELDKLKD